MMSTTKLHDLCKTTSQHRMVERYLRFVASRAGIKVASHTHYHHILPKASDFFPEFRRLSDHTWNGVHMTTREHYIAHWMLARAFPGTSQARAFWIMCNTLDKKTSHAYALSRERHIQSVITMTQNPERNRKISESLRGKPKTTEHKEKLIGHAVTDVTREKLRKANMGKKASPEARQKMSDSRRGKPGKTPSPELVAQISATKIAQKRRWFTNGISSIMASVAPDNTWRLGRSAWK